MPKRGKALELTFQEHIAAFLVREDKYGVLEHEPTSKKAADFSLN